MPDQSRISRCLNAPELGPRILFFSGGSALNDMSKVLKKYTHNSIHLVTPFDSGGSSAKLRYAFDMPAIGDLRARLMALADETITGHPEVIRLFTYRFPLDAENESLKRVLRQINAGQHDLIKQVSKPMQEVICRQLNVFLEAMPETFDLRGASIGNLILAGGYLNDGHRLDPIVFLFSKMVAVRGTVRNVVNDNLHLGVEMENGSMQLGQHLLTGKEAPPLTSPIKNLFLNKNLYEIDVANIKLQDTSRSLISEADLICYPPGSFYTSLMANLLPARVATTISRNQCPKVYIPNLCGDPEQLGKSSTRLVEVLLEQLRRDVPDDCGNERLLNIVLVDLENGQYPTEFDPERLAQLGIQMINTPLITERSAPWYDADLLVRALLSLT